MASGFFFGHNVFLLCFVQFSVENVNPNLQFSVEECKWPIVWSNDHTKLKLRTLSIYLKLTYVFDGHKQSHAQNYSVIIIKLIS